MIISNFIEELRQKEIEISFSSGKLKYSGPDQNITPELIEMLKKNKGKLIKYIWPKEFTNLMPINADGDKTPIFLVHGDNGNYVISEHLGPNQPVYGFFHPGSEGEAIPFRSVKEMARAYLDKVRAISPTGPYYLIGFSFGGVLAFEMAVQLQKLGNEVPFLVLIDSISPLVREPIKWRSNFFEIVKKNILGPFRRKLELNFKLLLCKCFILKNKPIPIKFRKIYLYKKYERLTKKHIPEKYKGDILLFRTIDNCSSFKYLGWETLVDNVKMIPVEANHTTIFKNKKSIEILQTEIEKHLTHVNNYK